MVACIPLDVLFNFSLGLALVFCAQNRVLAQGVFALPASLLVALYLALILAPMTAYLYIAHPSWAWMYWVDPDDIPGITLIPIVVGHCGVVVVGWYVGARLILAGQHNRVRDLAIGGVAIAVLGILVFWGRIGWYGTYVEFHEKRAIDLMDVKLGYVLVALVVGGLGAALYLCLELLHDGRRIRNH